MVHSTCCPPPHTVLNKLENSFLTIITSNLLCNSRLNRLLWFVRYHRCSIIFLLNLTKNVVIHTCSHIEVSYLRKNQTWCNRQSPLARVGWYLKLQLSSLYSHQHRGCWDDLGRLELQCLHHGFGWLQRHRTTVMYHLL